LTPKNYYIGLWKKLQANKQILPSFFILSALSKNQPTAACLAAVGFQHIQ